MNSIDLIYRAFTDYRKTTADSRDCIVRRNAVVKSDPESDRIEVTLNECFIDEDWVEAIERGLVHIEKALSEERQFIRSNGEVIPIEKVKHVSRDSVEHLAKHSNLLTRKSEGRDIIPDELYTVERLSDYAVYENRFLYMLLCYLRDFITLRYEKILELTNTYNGTLTLKKTIRYGKQSMTFDLKLTDERRDDEYLREHNGAADILGRIDLILKTVVLFLSTPLMGEVAKAPMLKPPVTKTNVLKMNKNFKGAVALYDFVAAYDKAGYTSVTKKKVIHPFPDGTADEIAELVTLSSFFAYEYGLGIGHELKRAYEAEEERRKEEELKRREEKFRQLRRRIKEMGADAEEYILLLEQKIRKLESAETRLAGAEKEIERLTAESDGLRTHIDGLNRRISDAEAEILSTVTRHAEEIAELGRAHESELERITSAYAEEKAEAERLHTAETERLKIAHAESVSAIRNEERAERERLSERLGAEAEKNLTRAETAERAYSELDGKYKRLDESKLLTEAKYNAVRAEHGLMTEADDFTDEESFGEIERQYNVFKSFFDAEWKKTKKKIRRSVLSEAKEKQRRQTEEKRAGKNGEKPSDRNG